MTKTKPTEIVNLPNGEIMIMIRCAVCIKENRPHPHRYSFVRVLSFIEYRAQEFYDAGGRHHYHCRQQGNFMCTFGHKFSRHNLPKVKCPTCGYDVDMQREIEAEMEIARPPRKPIDGRRKEIKVSEAQ